MEITSPPAPGPRHDAPDHVLLLHGMGCGPWVWREVVAGLPAHITATAAVIAGHREGTRLARLSGRTAPEQMVDDLERQIDELGVDRLHIVGNSLGGWLALRLAERRRALSVLCLAPAGGWRPGSLGERMVVSRFVVGHRVARRLHRQPGLLANPQVRRAVLSPVVQDPRRVTLADAQHFVHDMAECQALRAALGSAGARQLNAVLFVDAPVTIAWSTEDRVLSGPWAREGFQHLAAEQLEIPRAGHVPMLDVPDVVAGLIRERISAPPAQAGATGP
ncbi:alpha/beta fold hydrolase [Nocardioides immobilis]|uniref:alpha/beta fold hydrolase n=1 Tax=Nocardioides immobilis TaxID=2049295 RepID=UPI0011C3BFFE|nr:alpha/beta fold hydrolase [Nocardioides immobilis]